MLLLMLFPCLCKPTTIVWDVESFAILVKRLNDQEARIKYLEDAEKTQASCIETLVGVCKELESKKQDKIPHPTMSEFRAAHPGLIHYADKLESGKQDQVKSIHSNYQMPDGTPLFFNPKTKLFEKELR